MTFAKFDVGYRDLFLENEYQTANKSQSNAPLHYLILYNKATQRIDALKTIDVQIGVAYSDCRNWYTNKKIPSRTTSLTTGISRPLEHFTSNDFKMGARKKSARFGKCYTAR